MHVETFSRQLITHMDLEFKRKIQAEYINLVVFAYKWELIPRSYTQRNVENKAKR